MERLTLTPEQIAEIEAHRAELGVTSETVIIEGSNLVMDDHLQIDNSWYGVVVGPESGVVSFFVPDWPLLFAVDIEPYITDRAGPNGETMPIWPEEELAARTAAKTQAGEAEPQHGHHSRDLAAVLREAVKRLPHDAQKHAREVLKRHGVLDGKP